MLEAILGLFCISLCSFLLYGVMSVSLRINHREEEGHGRFLEYTSLYYDLSQDACRDSCLIEEVLSK